MRRLTLTALVLIGGAIGCENARVVDATGGGSSVTGPATGTGQAGKVGSGAVISCGAICSTPAGTVQPVNTPAEVYAAMQGRWLICGGWPAAALPPGTVGVEFGPASSTPIAGGATTAGGAMYYLVSGPSGPVHGQGSAYELTYDVSPETPFYAQLNMHPTPMSGFGGSVRYSPCPTELQLDINGTSRAILVPVDGAASVAPTPAPMSAGPAPAVPSGCTESCGGPRARPEMLLGSGDIYSALQGSWRICGGWDAPSDVVGVEFGPVSTAASSNDGGEGNMYYLVAGPTGPVRGQGFDYQLTYDASGGQLNMHPSPNSGFFATVAFSSCPVELDLSIAYNGSPTVLVPFE